MVMFADVISSIVYIAAIGKRLGLGICYVYFLKDYFSSNILTQVSHTYICKVVALSRPWYICSSNHQAIYHPALDKSYLIYLSEKSCKKGQYFPHLSEKSPWKGLIFETKIREKGRLEKLPDAHGYTWTPRVDPPGKIHTLIAETFLKNIPFPVSHWISRV